KISDRRIGKWYRAPGTIRQPSIAVLAEGSGGRICAADGYWYCNLICCATVFAKIKTMVPVLLIGIPLLAGLIGFSLKDAADKVWSLFASHLTLIVSLVGISMPRDSRLLSFSTEWMGGLNSRFAVG